MASLIPWRKRPHDYPVRWFGEDWERPGQFYRTMERMFDDMLSHFDLDLGNSEGGYGPRVDVVEHEKAVEVVADLPGMRVEDVTVNFANNMLTISGERKAEREREEHGGQYHRRERSYGRFSRAMRMPCDIDAEKIRAQFKNGLLTVTLGKTAEAQKQGRSISIQTT